MIYLNIIMVLDGYWIYIEGVIVSKIIGSQLLVKFNDCDIFVLFGGYQLIVCGIYFDCMISLYLVVVKIKFVVNDLEWKVIVFFYDVNLILLFNWQLVNNMVVMVINEFIQIVIDLVNNYYGIYSCGCVEVFIDGVIKMQVVVYVNNVGIIGIVFVLLFEYYNLIVDNIFEIEVDSKFGM